MDSAACGMTHSSVSASEDERLLVFAAKAGSAPAFEELVQRHWRRFFYIANRIVESREDAEDVVQEAFLKAYKHLQQFRGDSRFSTWLAAIVINQAKMKLRERRGNPCGVSLDEFAGQQNDPILLRAIGNSFDTPERCYAANELCQILVGAIANLRPHYRVVFVLRDLLHLSNEKTAALLGLSVANVKSRVLRARLQIRRRIRKYYFYGAFEPGIRRQASGSAAREERRPGYQPQRAQGLELPLWQ